MANFKINPLQTGSDEILQSDTQCRNVTMHRMEAMHCPNAHPIPAQFQLSLSLILLMFHIQNTLTYPRLTHSGILKQEVISLQLQVLSIH